MSDFTIGIKLGDGSFYQILEEGFSGKKRFVLTTIRDNQESMQIDFYRNRNGNMETAEYIGSLMIEDIAPAPKNTPEIEVILGLDESNKLNAVARNLATADKQTLSVVLESLESDNIYDMPDFEIDEDIETTKPADDITVASDDFEEKPLTGETYPVEEEDRRKTYLEKKKNPLFAVLFVFAGLIGVAGLTVLIYFLLSTFGVIKKEPLQIGTNDIVNESTDKTGTTTDNQQTGDKDAGTTQTGDKTTTDDKTAGGTSGTTGTENKDGTEKDTSKIDDTSKTDGSKTDDSKTDTSKTDASKTDVSTAGVYYLIKKGDTLWDISKAYYRDPFQWYRIYRYEPNNIKNPDLIFAGFTIFIPEN